jgi:hypothetical protein
LKCRKENINPEHLVVVVSVGVVELASEDEAAELDATELDTAEELATVAEEEALGTMPMGLVGRRPLRLTILPPDMQGIA